MTRNFVTPTHGTKTEHRCESTSPIAKFDEGPRRCVREENHTGCHKAKVSDGRYVRAVYDHTLWWSDSAWVSHGRMYS